MALVISRFLKQIGLSAEPPALPLLVAMHHSLRAPLACRVPVSPCSSRALSGLVVAGWPFLPRRSVQNALQCDCAVQSGGRHTPPT